MSLKVSMVTMLIFILLFSLYMVVVKGVFNAWANEKMRNAENRQDFCNATPLDERPASCR